MMDLKKPTTYKQQIEILKQKGIIIDDEDKCMTFLSEVNYYRFSAYFLPFKNMKTNSYFAGITFHRVQRIYEFDEKIRNLIFGVIQNIEILLRVKLAYYHSHTYGADGYLTDSNFNNRHDHEQFLKQINARIKENRLTPVVQHHNNNYNGKFPIWVLIEFFSMGMISHFYTDMKTSDKKKFAREINDTNYLNLESWLRCLTDLRNKCAHYSRVYYWNFPAIPKFSTNNPFVPDRRLFSQIYMLKNMYPDQRKWKANILTPLSSLLEEYESDISLTHIGFPVNWLEILQ